MDRDAFRGGWSPPASSHSHGVGSVIGTSPAVMGRGTPKSEISSPPSLQFDQHIHNSTNMRRCLAPLLMQCVHFPGLPSLLHLNSFIAKYYIFVLKNQNFVTFYEMKEQKIIFQEEVGNNIQAYS